MERRAEREEIALVADEAESVGLFLALNTQWRVHGMTGIRLGLDYAALPSTAGMMGIALDARRFMDLRVMENEALAAFARKAARG